MASVELRDLQFYMLDILMELDRICKKHDIQYFLAYGSCLGAVRHKGFIPWDDDIDIHMKADDYLKFIEVCKTELDEKYYLQNRLEDAKAFVFWNQFGVKNSTSINKTLSHIHKPWGICVDIFPIFPYSKDSKIQNKRQKMFKIMKLLSLKSYHVATIKNEKGIQKLKKMVHCMIPDKINCILFSYLFKKLADKKGLGEICWTSYSVSLPHNVYFEDEWISETVDLDFEHVKLPCPINWDAYLTTFYHNYMQIPKDKTKHSDDSDVIIRFDECYENYWS